MNPMLSGWLAVAAALLVSAAGARWLAGRPRLTRALLDHPNARSLHQDPIPRSGGLAVLAGLAAALATGWLWNALAAGPPLPGALVWLAVAVLPVAAVSLYDDLGHCPRRLRLAVHVLAALILLGGGLAWGHLGLPGLDWPLPGVVAGALTVLFTVWMLNLYNFMDGMDGFAGGMALFGFGALAVLGWRAGDPAFAAAAAVPAAAAAGFLWSNFPPARIFLGDLGSSTLGLLAAGFSLWGARDGLFPLWTAALAFSPFIVDATWTLGRRLARGERVWEAHRSHHYQRLVLAGWGHRKTVLRSYVLMAGAAASAVAAPGLATWEQWAVIGAWAVVYALIHFRVGLEERLVASGVAGRKGAPG